MKFICAQPAIDYYTWQVEVMINNFIKNGVNPNDIHILCAYHDLVPNRWKKLQMHYNDVCFFFYKDTRPLKGYIPSIRPHILYQHWLKHSELEKEVVFYHDSDIILAKPYEFEGLSVGDECYVADTVSYIGANYIRSKGEKYLDMMVNIVGVDKQIVIDNEKDSGGAQYILKGVDAEFWKEMYYNVEKMYADVNNEIFKDKAENPSYHELQIWCADMWCLLWGLWKRKKIVKVTPTLSFSWATSHISDWNNHPIFHNAGVTEDRKDLFFKAAYINKLPYNDIILQNINKNYCSYKYAEELLKTKEISCLI